MPLKCYTEYSSKFGKFSSGYHKTGKGKFSFQSQRRAMLKNVQTTLKLHLAHASEVLLKILQTRLQQYFSGQLPDVQAEFRKGRRTRKKTVNICWIIEKAKEFQKTIYLCLINYTKTFKCVDHNKLRKTLNEMELPDHLTCLLGNLYMGQEAAIRTLYGTTDWFRIKTGVQQGRLLSSCLFNLYAEHIMRNAGLEEIQAGIKTGRINIKNLR